MSRKFHLSAVIAALLSHALHVSAASDPDVQAIREQVQQLAKRMEQSSSTPAGNSGGEDAFNPAISLILGGTYGTLQQDPAIPATGFAMNANPGHEQGFNLGESELVITANVDPQFRGVGRFAIDPASGISVENAFVQRSSLGNGLNLKMGRFFSGLGYLNEQHAHAWDFADQPLVYAALWDNQLSDDGVQIKWLAPTDTFIEFGGEIGRGSGFPGSARAKNGSGAGALFAHIGDDIGIEHNWRAGVSLYQTRRENAISTISSIDHSFSGNSKTAGLDVVWKYAPNGNLRDRYVKFQGEYFRRKENGLLTYNLTTTDNYTVTQSGWYLQGVAQFMPHWRTGLRYDQLDPGTAQVGTSNAGNVISDYGYRPSRTSLMVDYSPSEFSHLRLQLARDHSRQGLADNQLFVQYIMSLGAHDAHQY